MTQTPNFLSKQIVIEQLSRGYVISTHLQGKVDQPSENDRTAFTDLSELLAYVKAFLEKY